jgi:hypothetical protein
MNKFGSVFRLSDGHKETVTVEQPGFGVVVVEFGKIATDKWILASDDSILIVCYVTETLIG